VQNGDINHRIQVIEQNGKDIPFISIDSLWRLLPILNRYIEKYRYIKIFDILRLSILKWMIWYDMIYRYRNDTSMFLIYRPISNVQPPRSTRSAFVVTLIRPPHWYLLN